MYNFSSLQDCSSLEARFPTVADGTPLKRFQACRCSKAPVLWSETALQKTWEQLLKIPANSKQSINEFMVRTRRHVPEACNSMSRNSHVRFQSVASVKFKYNNSRPHYVAGNVPADSTDEGLLLNLKVVEALSRPPRSFTPQLYLRTFYRLQPHKPNEKEAWNLLHWHRSQKQNMKRKQHLEKWQGTDKARPSVCRLLLVQEDPSYERQQQMRNSHRYPWCGARWHSTKI